MESERYWLLDVLEQNRIDSDDTVAAFFKNKENIHKLRDVVDDWTKKNRNVKQSGINLLAGSGISLSDELSCGSYHCRAQQIDILFRHGWHYFDKILIPDMAGLRIRRLCSGSVHNEQYVLRDLVYDIQLVLHLTRIGALNLITYIPKLSLLSDEMDSIKLPIEDTTIQNVLSKIGTDLLSNSKFSFVRQPGKKSIDISMSHPSLDVVLSMTVENQSKIKEDLLKGILVEDITAEHGQMFARDYYVSQRYNAAFGSTFWSHQYFFEAIQNRENNINTMPFYVALPTLENIPVEKLIELRQDEHEAFKRFQMALKKATQLAISEAPDKMTTTVANTIMNDIIAPEIQSIDQKLKIARDKLSKKVSVSVALGAIATTCGCLLGVPLFGAGMAGIGTMLAGTGKSADKYLDEAKDIEASEMYFMWKALKHVRR